MNQLEVELVRPGSDSDVLERFSAHLAFVRYKLRQQKQLSLYFVS